VIADFAGLHRDDPEIMARVVRARREYIADGTPFIARLQALGLARTDMPPETIASMVIATIEGHSIHWEIYGEGWETVAEAAIRVIQP